MCAVDAALVSREGDRPSPTLDRMLHLAGARPDRAVAVCGPASLPVLIGLCRLGYGRVTCACDAHAPGEAGASEVLVLTGPCGAQALEALVARGARLLADVAVVVAHEASLDDDAALAAALESQGLEPTWRVHDLAGPCLAAFGVRRRGSARAAISRAA